MIIAFVSVPCSLLEMQQQTCPTFDLQVGICGSVHGIEFHESNVSFSRNASKLCVLLVSVFFPRFFRRSMQVSFAYCLFCVLSADFISHQAHQSAFVAVLSREPPRMSDIHMRQRFRYARRAEVSDKRTKVRPYRAICDNVALRRAV
jgi:hypothetical protein